jgi:chorismate mutase/prephenate dehydratase
VPVENSTEGAVNRTLDLLLGSSLRILGERSLLIRHCLLAKNGDMTGVTKIMAHPQALAQCQSWLNREYPGIKREPVSSNSEAARLASLDPSIAAIASDIAARAWGLQVLAAGIQDDSQNRTRFLAIGQLAILPSGRDKTSLILAVANRAGAVYEMLALRVRVNGNTIFTLISKGIAMMLPSKKRLLRSNNSVLFISCWVRILRNKRRALLRQACCLG